MDSMMPMVTARSVVIGSAWTPTCIICAKTDGIRTGCCLLRPTTSHTMLSANSPQA